jgi:ABC-type amino acid transport substrate-binding protein
MSSRLIILTVIEVSSARQLFALLSKGRIQLAIADRLVGASFAEEYADSGQQLLAVKKPLAGEVYHIAFSKKSEARHLIPALNRVIAELKHEGVVQRLIGDTSAVAGLAPDSFSNQQHYDEATTRHTPQD